MHVATVREERLAGQDRQLLGRMIEPSPHPTTFPVDITTVTPDNVSLDKDVTMRSRFTCAIAASLLILPSAVLGVDAAAKSSGPDVSAPPTLKNVELATGGVLHGQLVDIAGNPVVAVTVSVTSGDTVLRITTDKNGRFAAGHLKGGVCVIQVNEASYACRLWHQGTAPPNAIDTIAVVQDGNTVRGQHSKRSRKRLYRLTTEQHYGLFISALGGTALALALTQDAS
ncbi:MAG: hypothetical protein GY758_32830 [Fuerstiella sp.]|nr:hypothetical protein [Fuerstiella sp.]MCP4783703.1 hypothetical protein [Fuerstiella sp.]MCP4857062.1 hypothetical protein [Fuerstiella sp.]